MLRAVGSVCLQQVVTGVSLQLGCVSCGGELQCCRAVRCFSCEKRLRTEVVGESECEVGSLLCCLSALCAVAASPACVASVDWRMLSDLECDFPTRGHRLAKLWLPLAVSWRMSLSLTLLVRCASPCDGLQLVWWLCLWCSKSVHGDCSRGAVVVSKAGRVLLFCGRLSPQLSALLTSMV